MTTTRRLAAAFDARLSRMSATEAYRQHIAALQAECNRRTA